MADFYVSSSGSDSNDGSNGSPWLTIAHALANSAAGDTIRLNGGDTFTWEGEISDRTLGAYGSGLPIVTNSINTTATIRVSGTGVVDGLDVRNTGGSNPIATMQVAGGGRIANCTIHSNTNKSVTISGAGTQIVEDCTLTDDLTACAQLLTFFQTGGAIARGCQLNRTQASSAAAGIFFHGDGAGASIVEDCDVNSTGGNHPSATATGIRTFAGDTVTSPQVIRRTRVRGNWEVSIEAENDLDVFGCFVDGRLHVGTQLIQANDGATLRLEACTIVSTDQVVWQIGSNSPSTLRARNNVQFFTSGSRNYLAGGGTIDADYNRYFGSGGTNTFNGGNFATWQSGGNDTNGAVSDPGFRDSGAGDFAPTDASTMLDAGTTSNYDDRLFFNAVFGQATVSVGTTTNVGAFLAESQSVSDTLGPVVASATIQLGGTSAILELTESESPPVLPENAITGFTISTNGDAVSVLTAWRTASTQITLAFDRAIPKDATVTLEYAPGNVTDSAASPNAMAAFSGFAVTNNSELESVSGLEDAVNTLIQNLDTEGIRVAQIDNEERVALAGVINAAAPQDNGRPWSYGQLDNAQMVMDAYSGVLDSDGNPCKIGDQVASWVSVNGTYTFTATPGADIRLEIDPMTGLRALHFYSGILKTQQPTNPWAAAGVSGALSIVGRVARGVISSAAIAWANAQSSSPTSATAGMSLTFRANQNGLGFDGEDSYFSQGRPNGFPRQHTSVKRMGNAGTHHNIVTTFMDEASDGNRVARFYDHNGEVSSISVTGQNSIAWVASYDLFTVGGSQWDPADDSFANTEEMYITHLGAWGNIGIDPQWGADLAANLGRTAPHRSILFNGDSRTSNLLLNGTVQLANEFGYVFERNADNGWIVTDLDARLDTLIAADQVYDVGVFWIGVNHWTTYTDSAGVATVFALVRAQIQKCLDAGLFKHVFLLNDTPRNQSDNERDLQLEFRNLLEDHYIGNGSVTLVDSWRLVQDPGDEKLLSTDYTGDGVHFNTAALPNRSTAGYMRVIHDGLMPMIQEHLGDRSGTATQSNGLSLSAAQTVAIDVSEVVNGVVGAMSGASIKLVSPYNSKTKRLELVQRADYTTGSAVGPVRVNVALAGVSAGDEVRFGASSPDGGNIQATGTIAESDGDFYAEVELPSSLTDRDSSPYWKWELEHVSAGGDVSPLVIDADMTLHPSHAEAE